MSAIFAHHPQCQVDIRSRDDVTRQVQRQSSLHHRTDHQHGRDILRTDATGHLQIATLQRLACDAQGRKALFAHVFDVGTQPSQCIHQRTYRTVLHALRTRQHVGTSRQTEIGRHEAHGRTSRLDIDLRGQVLSHRLDNHIRIVAVADVLWKGCSTTKHMNNQSTV